MLITIITRADVFFLKVIKMYIFYSFWKLLTQAIYITNNMVQIKLTELQV